MVGTHKWFYAHYTHPDVTLNQFINVAIIDGWNAQMNLCSLHPPRRHIESVYQRSYNWWLGRTNDSMLITPTQTSRWISLSTLHPTYNWWLDGWDAQMTLCSLHPPRRRVQFINAIIDGWNAQMIYAHYTHPDVTLNQFINVAIIDGWNAQMNLCSLHPPRRHIESVYQRSYNWWLGRTNDSMLITPTQTSRWISLSTLL